MGVDLQTYRCRIGTFGRSVQQVGHEVTKTGGGDFAKLIGAVSFIGCLLLIAGVEPNPGPGPCPEQKASEKDIAILAQHIVTNWELLGPFLGVPQAEIERIQLDKSSTVTRVYALLQSWRKKHEDEATLDKVFTALKTLPAIRVDWHKLSEMFKVKDPTQGSAEGPINTTIHQCPTEERSKRESERKKGFLKLLQTFGLKEHYPGKITLHLALSNIFRFMNEENEERKSCKLVPWYMLNGILTQNSEARDTAFKKCKELRREDFADSDSDDSNGKNVSALDILVVIFQCSDARLKQILTKKLFDCQIAVPFMISTFTNSFTYELNVWPLRFIRERNRSTLFEHCLQDSETLVISFARFGRPDMSKSCVLNQLMSSENISTFFNKDSASGMSGNCIANGYVELFASREDNSYLAYLNIRGDILLDFDNDCLESFKCISDVFVLNVTERDFHKYQTSIKNIISGFPTVVVMSDEPKQTSSDTSIGGNKVKLISYRNRNVVETAENVSKVIKELNITPNKTFEKKIEDYRFSNLTKDEQRADCKESYDFSTALIDKMKSELMVWACSQHAIQKLDTHWREVITPASFCTCPKIRDNIKQNDESLKDVILLYKEQVKSMSTSVSMFLDWLHENRKHKEKVYYGLCWINVMLRNNTRKVITEGRKMIDTFHEKIQTMRKNMPDTESDTLITEHYESIKITNDNIKNASIDVNHLLREIGHICTAALYLQSFPEALGRGKIDDLSELFADLALQFNDD